MFCFGRPSLVARYVAQVVAIGFAVPLLCAQQPFGERIEVNITNVDAVVTDQNGNRVRGLVQEDFEIIDNGVRQLVTNFSEAQRLSDATGDGRADRAGVNLPPLKRPVNLLLFVDNQHLQPKTRARAAEALQRFLSARRGDDVRVIAIRYSGGHASRPLVGDTATVSKNLGEFLDASPPSQLAIQSERKHLQDLIDGSRDADQAMGHVVAWASSVHNDNVRTLSALQSAIASMSGFAGRKVLLFVTEGIPQRAGAELFRHWADKFHKNADLQAMEFDMSKELGGLTRFANANGVSLYTLNALGTASEAFDMNSGLRLRDAEELRSSRQDSLDFLAEQTGGAAIRNQNVFDAPLASVADDFSSYYSLAYRTPASRSPIHKIEVRVKKPGLRVRTPQEYTEQTAEQRVRAQVEAMFVVPPADSNPLGVTVARKEGHGNGGTRVVPFLIRVPRERLTTVTGGHVTLYVAVMDGEGARTPVRSLGVDIPKEGDVLQPLDLAMRTGSQTIVAGARDDVSGVVSLVRVEVAND